MKNKKYDNKDSNSVGLNKRVVIVSNTENYLSKCV